MIAFSWRITLTAAMTPLRDRWSTVRRALGSGMSAEACRVRAERLAAIEAGLEELARQIAELRRDNREGRRALLGFRSAEGSGAAAEGDAKPPPKP